MSASYFLRQLIRRYFSDQIPQEAAELSYFLLFSIFPLLMVVSALLSFVNISQESLQPVLHFLPTTLSVLITQYLSYLAATKAVSPLLIGIPLTLYFLSRAIRSLMRTVNRIYRVEVQRNFIQEFFLSVVLTAAFLVSMAGSLLLVMAGRTALRLIGNWMPFLQELLDRIHDAGYPLVIALIFLFLLMLNRIVPNVSLTWRNALPGSVFSLLAWLLISFAFSFYVDNMARYTVIYGSLGAIIVLMLWLYLTGIVLLSGPLVNHILMQGLM
jgi:membrane protein